MKITASVLQNQSNLQKAAANRGFAGIRMKDASTLAARHLEGLQ
jgi:hypothetical protein